MRADHRRVGADLAPEARHVHADTVDEGVPRAAPVRAGEVAAVRPRPARRVLGAPQVRLAAPRARDVDPPAADLDRARRPRRPGAAGRGPSWRSWRRAAPGGRDRRPAARGCQRRSHAQRRPSRSSEPVMPRSVSTESPTRSSKGSASAVSSRGREADLLSDVATGVGGVHRHEPQRAGRLLPGLRQRRDHRVADPEARPGPGSVRVR